jgi:hypothetical protein
MRINQSRGKDDGIDEGSRESVVGTKIEVIVERYKGTLLR